MRRRFISVILFAVITALIASTAAYRAIAARTGVKLPARPTVLVASRDLTMGALVQSGDVERVEWAGATGAQWATQEAEVIGRGVVANINRGEPFAENRLAQKGAGAGLAAIIPAGMRAVAVHVDEVVGVSGFVLPGMRVDILTSGTPPGQNGTITRTILQNVQVLSAGQNLERDAQGKPAPVQVVNLLVTPAEAERLSLAGGQMRVQLVLRNPLDTEVVRTPGISSADLLIDAPTPRPAPRRAAAASVSRPSPVEPATLDPHPLREMVPIAVPVTVETITGTKRESVVVGHAVEMRAKEAAK